MPPILRHMSYGAHPMAPIFLRHLSYGTLPMAPILWHISYGAYPMAPIVQHISYGAHPMAPSASYATYPTAYILWCHPMAPSTSYERVLWLRSPLAKVNGRLLRMTCLWNCQVKAIGFKLGS